MSSKIEIYSGPFCPYCVRAKSLLDKLGAVYDEYDVQKEPDKLAEMQQRTNGARTIPQIFINDQLIGGSDELHALHSKGELEPLLQA